MRVLLAVILTLSLCTIAFADRGTLSIKCDGTDAKYLADQRNTQVKDGARVISGDGYAVYRIQIGNSTIDRLYYTVSMTAYKLEFSADGREWSPKIMRMGSTEFEDDTSNQAIGFGALDRRASKQSRQAYFRFSRHTESKRDLILKSIALEISADRLPQGFSGGTRPAPTTPGLLMMLVGVLAVGFGLWRWKTPFRLFGLGALLWVVAVAVKVGLAVFLNKQVEGGLQALMPKHPADVTFWIYIGVLTGITEVGIFLAMARWFQRRQWSWKDAASVGVGFGAIEAILLGLGLAGAALAGQSQEASMFIPPLERFLTIFIHTAATVMVIYAITRREWGWFILAFLYKSGVDAIAAYVLLAGKDILTSRPLVVELAYFGPFAYVAIPILWWLRRQWRNPSMVLGAASRPSDPGR
jgi:uncharacterized membrane protein YhfC